MDGFIYFMLLMCALMFLTKPILLVYACMGLAVIAIIAAIANSYKEHEKLYTTLGMIGVFVFIGWIVIVCNQHDAAAKKNDAANSYTSSTTTTATSTGYSKSSSGGYKKSSSSSSKSSSSKSSSSSSGLEYRRCGKNGCERNGNNGNGTVFCDYHAAQYARESGKMTCSVSGCYDSRTSNSSYCYTHTCRKDGCYNKASDSSDDRYCSTHSTKSSKSSTSSTSKTTYTPSKKYTSSKPKKKMPDCDDYEDYDDFMDDWDGNMPDGSDAEDYWENW